MTTDDVDFVDDAENGIISIDSHEKMLRVAYMYVHTCQGRGGFFDAVGPWTYFYLAQICYGYYHQADIEDGKNLFTFDEPYAEFSEMLAPDVWKQYYSLEFLLQPATARLWRLPNLRDLPSSSDPIAQLRDKPIGNNTRLPHWADNVANTLCRQKTLPQDTITQIAIDTLQDTLSRLREHHPEVLPYSETQARFWLKYMHLDFQFAGGPSYFGIWVAQGNYNVWEWERHYTPERWNAISTVALEPDLDGTAKPEVWGCGWPDGGAVSVATERGWVPELGSEEEVEFMAAVAAKETEGWNMEALDYSIRSHMLLSVLQLAFMPESQREEFLQTMKHVVS